MPAAAIQINGVTGSNDDLPLNTPVQLSNDDVGAEVTYAWTIVDQPEGTPTVTLTNPSIENPLFTPTKEGTYLLQLVVNAMTATEVIGTAIVGVRYLKSNERPPAAAEALEASTARGWAEALNRSQSRLNQVLGDANIIVARCGSASIGVGTIVTLSKSTALIATGLPGEDRVIDTTITNATDPTTIGSMLGVCLGTPSGVSVTNGGLILVRIAGLSELAPSGSPAVGDPVFVSDAGMPALTPGTYHRIIGRVLSTAGGVYYWVVDNSVRVASRVTPALDAMIVDGTANWVRLGGATGVPLIVWATTSSSAAGLVYPLRVHPGEVLYKIEATIIQGSSTARIIATLMHGSNETAAGVESAPVTSPASAFATETAWDVQPGSPLVLPKMLPRPHQFWLYFTSTGAGGTTRSIGSVTAHVRPS